MAELDTHFSLILRRDQTLLSPQIIILITIVNIIMTTINTNITDLTVALIIHHHLLSMYYMPCTMLSAIHEFYTLPKILSMSRTGITSILQTEKLKGK